ncbi:four helix bundle protein [Pontibacter diazotrophicus]|uniref:Four helix bundle protein n=1 Tax=Pontibacter diazotrophicus TaxID=1400979 RepID=A0A3D8L0V0_9BACT|nr:four helix bundle protein [Pontibacter diazotrophicus]RDV11054.1 four helix bundle protein [Pontibacter diazotrophicus]
MIHGKENVLYNKAYAFAIRVVKAYQYLEKEKREFILAKQLLRSGTSIGANVAEANGAISDAEFSAKLSIAYKECLETKYWTDLLKDTGYINEKQHVSMFTDADELGKMLFTSIRKIRGLRTDK